jgi:hypothetical protein
MKRDGFKYCYLDYFSDEASRYLMNHYDLPFKARKNDLLNMVFFLDRNASCRVFSRQELIVSTRLSRFRVTPDVSGIMELDNDILLGSKAGDHVEVAVDDSSNPIIIEGGASNVFDPGANIVDGEYEGTFDNEPVYLIKDNDLISGYFTFFRDANAGSDDEYSPGYANQLSVTVENGSDDDEMSDDEVDYSSVLSAIKTRFGKTSYLHLVQGNKTIGMMHIMEDDIKVDIIPEAIIGNMRKWNEEAGHATRSSREITYPRSEIDFWDRLFLFLETYVCCICVYFLPDYRDE